MEAGLKGLAPDHWEEVANNKDTIPLDIDWERYRALDDDGSLHVLTARDDGELVGYVMHVIAPSQKVYELRYFNINADNDNEE